MFTNSSTEYCGESNEIVLVVFVTNVVIVNKQPGLHLCYAFTYQFHWSGNHETGVHYPVSDGRSPKENCHLWNKFYASF